MRQIATGKECKLFKSMVGKSFIFTFQTDRGPASLIAPCPSPRPVQKVGLFKKPTFRRAPATSRPPSLLQAITKKVVADEMNTDFNEFKKEFIGKSFLVETDIQDGRVIVTDLIEKI
jgi:hypothetical protein